MTRTLSQAQHLSRSKASSKARTLHPAYTHKATLQSIQKRTSRRSQGQSKQQTSQPHRRTFQERHSLGDSDEDNACSSPKSTNSRDNWRAHLKKRGPSSLDECQQLITHQHRAKRQKRLPQKEPTLSPDTTPELQDRQPDPSLLFDSDTENRQSSPDDNENEDEGDDESDNEGVDKSDNESDDDRQFAWGHCRSRAGRGNLILSGSSRCGTTELHNAIQFTRASWATGANSMGTSMWPEMHLTALSKSLYKCWNLVVRAQRNKGEEFHELEPLVGRKMYDCIAEARGHIMYYVRDLIQNEIHLPHGIDANVHFLHLADQHRILSPDITKPGSSKFISPVVVKALGYFFNSRKAVARDPVTSKMFQQVTWKMVVMVSTMIVHAVQERGIGGNAKFEGSTSAALYQQVKSSWDNLDETKQDIVLFLLTTKVKARQKPDQASYISTEAISNIYENTLSDVEGDKDFDFESFKKFSGHGYLDKARSNKKQDIQRNGHSENGNANPNEVAENARHRHQDAEISLNLGRLAEDTTRTDRDCIDKPANCSSPSSCSLNRIEGSENIEEQKRGNTQEDKCEGRHTYEEKRFEEDVDNSIPMEGKADDRDGSLACNSDEEPETAIVQALVLAKKSSGRNKAKKHPQILPPKIGKLEIQVRGGPTFLLASNMRWQTFYKKTKIQVDNSDLQILFYKTLEMREGIAISDDKDLMKMRESMRREGRSCVEVYGPEGQFPDSPSP